MGTEKLHKVLARMGLGSRRQIEGWIEQGRVKVDGRVAEIGERVGSGARIAVDDEPVRRPAAMPGAPGVLLYHKPVGEICTRSDPARRPSVFEHLPPPPTGRWISVGRLDFNTSGLLLFTDDGDLADALMHPASGLEREYLVRVLGTFSEAQLQRLRHGIPLDGKPARFHRLDPVGGGKGSNRWFRVTIVGGRYREVRRLWQAVGGRVSRLKRVRYGPIRLPRDLEPGHWRRLDGSRMSRLRAQLRGRRVH